MGRSAKLRWRGRLAALAAGGIAACGQAPLNLGALTLLGLMAAFALFLRSPSVRQALGTGWWTGAGYFAVSLNWIVEPFLVDIAQTGWMAPFALVFMAIGLGVFWAAGFAVARRLAPNPLGWAAAMALAELARGYVLTGFAWAMPVHAWVNSLAALGAAWVGAVGLNALLFFCAALVVWFYRQDRQRWRAPFLLLALVALSLIPPPAAPQPDPAGPIVRLVQPNAPQHEKWRRDRIPVFFDRQIDLTYQGAVPDVVIWPETAVATPLAFAEPAFDRMIAAARGATVVTGIQRRDGLLNYNSLVVLDGGTDPVSIYDKHHLVPFGEYLPLGDWLATKGLRGLAAEDGAGYAAGIGPTTLDIPGLGRVLPLICYEAVFPQDMATPLRPDVILQITNDAWFGAFSGPYQHLAQARFRAIEQGLPMLRAANTGVSGLIDARGRVLASLPLGVAGKLDVTVPRGLSPTVYSKSKDGPLAMILLLLLLFAFLRTVKLKR